MSNKNSIFGGSQTKPTVAPSKPNSNQAIFNIPPPPQGYNSISNPYTNQQVQSNSYVPQMQMQQNFEVPQMAQMNCYMPQQQGLFGGSCKEGLTLLSNKKEDEQKKIVAVIVSFCGGCSYDSLFTSVEQKSAEGTKVQVYSCQSNYITKVFDALKGQPCQDETIKGLVNEIKEVDADCVVFNWQCSSNYGSQFFPEGNQTTFQFIKWAVDAGHMTMFSDFSLKALIKSWKPEILGPNPFVKVSQTSSAFNLRFNANDLKECPSAQLQIVGEMAEGGKCHVEAMGGTIVYSVDSHAPKTQAYKIQVLTVAEYTQPLQPNFVCKVGELTGTAGHVLLTFKSGGHMITSMGHWIQLMKIDTSEKKLFEVAEKQYGAQYAQQMQMQYAQLDTTAKKSYVSKNAINFVQNQAPCSNMSYKTKF